MADTKTCGCESNQEGDNQQMNKNENFDFMTIDEMKLWLRRKTIVIGNRSLKSTLQSYCKEVKKDPYRHKSKQSLVELAKRRNLDVTKKTRRQLARLLKAEESSREFPSSDDANESRSSTKATNERFQSHDPVIEESSNYHLDPTTSNLGNTKAAVPALDCRNAPVNVEGVTKYEQDTEKRIVNIQGSEGVRYINVTMVRKLSTNIEHCHYQLGLWKEVSSVHKDTNIVEGFGSIETFIFGEQGIASWRDELSEHSPCFEVSRQTRGLKDQRGKLDYKSEYGPWFEVCNTDSKVIRLV